MLCYADAMLMLVLGLTLLLLLLCERVLLLMLLLLTKLWPSAVAGLARRALDIYI